ncbi:MAG: hypothetical protein MUF05_06570 [Candidatus Omnitrophica bacterium]|jgi:hypothetical protein|nr:hypothetical protein [Candidatus Omnitrophota bacterium]
MTEKKLQMKTSQRLGKGGNLISLIIIFCLILQPLAFAARSSAGGGEISKVDWGKIATSAGISIGTAAIGASLNSGFEAATPVTSETATMGTRFSNTFTGMGNLITNTPGSTAVNAIKPFSAMGDALKNSFALTNMAKGYTTFVAASQVGRLVGVAGNYYGWKPATTMIVSGVAIGATAGFLNPSDALGDAKPTEALNSQINNPSLPTHSFGITQTTNSFSNFGFNTNFSNMLKGASVGALSGFANSAVIAALDRDKINSAKNPGATAQILGMFAGVSATNLGRSIWDPKVYHYDSKYIDAKSGNEVSLDKNKMWQFSDVSVVPKGPLEPGRYLAEPTSNPDILKWTDTKAQIGGGQIFGRFAKAAFVDTFNAQSWPGLAASSMSIIATNSLPEKKKYLAPLVGGLVQSVSYPIFSGMANTYGLDASRYFGSKQDKIEARLRYDYTLRAAGVDLASAKDIALIQKTYKDYRDGKITFEQYNKELNKIASIPFELLLVQGDAQKLSQEQLQNKINNALGANNSGIVEQERINSKALAGSLNLQRGSIDEAQMNRNLAIASLRKQLAEKMPMFAGKVSMGQLKGLADALTTDEALKQIGVTRGQIFASQVYSGVTSGVFESLVTGGLQSALDKNFGDERNMTTKMLFSSGVNMAASVIRGAAWSLGWNNSTADKSEWQNELDFVMPQPYKESFYLTDVKTGSMILDQYGQAVENPSYNAIQDVLSQTSYDRDLLAFNKFVATYNMTPGNGLILHRERMKWDYNQGAEDPRWVASLVADDRNPGLMRSVGASMQQSNVEWANKMFTFGLPLTSERGKAGFGVDSSQISSFAWHNYANSYSAYSLPTLVNIYNSKGLAETLSYLYSQSNQDAAGNAIAGALVQVPGVTRMFNMQPQRLVRLHTLKDVSEPITRQQLAFKYAAKAAGQSENLIWNADYGFTNTFNKQTASNYADNPLARKGGFETLSTEISYPEKPASWLDAYLVDSASELTLKTEQGLQHWYMPADLSRNRYSIQAQVFHGGMGAIETKFWVFPNPMYGVRPQMSESDYLRKSGLTK